MGKHRPKEAIAAEAQVREQYAMKLSAFHPRLCCQGCGGFGIATKWLPKIGPVCPECFDHADFDGRATVLAGPAATDRGPKAQLALFES